MNDTTDERVRENWGHAFRDMVASGKTAACLVLAGALPLIAWTEGVAQWFGLVAGLVALAALFPKSPVVAAVVQRIPGLPVKGQGA